MREFPGGLVVRTRRFHCGGPGSTPGWGTKIPQAAQCGQKKKNKQKKLMSEGEDLEQLLYRNI